MPVHQTYTEEKKSKISNIAFAILFFSYKKYFNEIAILNTSESTALDETIKTHQNGSL